MLPIAQPAHHGSLAEVTNFGPRLHTSWGLRLAIGPYTPFVEQLEGGRQVHSLTSPHSWVPALFTLSSTCPLLLGQVVRMGLLAGSFHKPAYGGLLHPIFMPHGRGYHERPPAHPVFITAAVITEASSDIGAPPPWGR